MKEKKSGKSLKNYLQDQNHADTCCNIHSWTNDNKIYKSINDIWYDYDCFNWLFFSFKALVDVQYTLSNII